jgi:hypothetical protein
MGDSSVSVPTKHHAEEIALVVSLTKLHNYCIEEADIATEATVRDRFTNRNNGCVRMIFSDDAEMDLPAGLLYGGHH